VQDTARLWKKREVIFSQFAGAQLSWLERLPVMQEVAGSSLVAPPFFRAKIRFLQHGSSSSCQQANKLLRLLVPQVGSVGKSVDAICVANSLNTRTGRVM
jgi:hypothetical protein